MPLTSNDIPLFSPDFRCLEIVKYYKIVSLKEAILHIRPFFIAERGRAYKKRINVIYFTCTNYFLKTFGKDKKC